MNKKLNLHVETLKALTAEQAEFEVLGGALSNGQQLCASANAPCDTYQAHGCTTGAYSACIYLNGRRQTCF